jgi:hypothetical protein
LRNALSDAECRIPSNYLANSENPENSEVSGFLVCTTGRRPVGSEKSYFVTRLFMKMAVSMVGG